MRKVQAIQTKDYIADSIRREILAGNMEPGEELTQETLAMMLGVSRMPVREALQLLEQEGFIERLPNRHMVVARLEEHRLEEIMDMAAAMETEIAVLLHKKGIAGQAVQILESMEETLAGQRTEWQIERVVELELDYHGFLADLLDNSYIEQLFQKVLGGYVSYMILKMEHDVEASYRLLSSLQKEMEGGSRERIHECLRQYYGELLVSWNRKGQI